MDEVLTDVLENLLIEFWFFQFQYILHQIVSIRVFDKLTHLIDDLSSKLNFLVHSPLFKAALHNTAAVLLFAYEDAVCDTGFEDELSMLAGFL